VYTIQTDFQVKITDLVKGIESAIACPSVGKGSVRMWPLNLCISNFQQCSLVLCSTMRFEKSGDAPINRKPLNNSLNPL
jgi:hypothetical protein